MKYRYYFCKPNKPELISFLDQNQIKYEVLNYGSIGLNLVKFILWSNQKQTAYYLEELEKITEKPLIFIEYTESERMKANFLWLLPKKQVIDIINEDESFAYSCQYTSIMGHICYKHMAQKSIIAIAKEPSAKTKTAFWTESTGFGEVFVKREVLDAVRSDSLSGIDFLNVRLKNGTYSENLFQMTSKNVIDRSCIEPGHGEVVEKCPVCGKEQYDFSSGSYRLHLNTSKIKENSDLYITERMYGAGFAFPLYVISQKFYRLLKENGLTGGASFSPVVEVEW